MKRYNGIAGLKGIGILLIILLHVSTNGNYSHINKDAFLQLGIMVQLFFMVSSFGMCCGYYDRIKNNAISLNEFYGKRYKKILPFFAVIVLVEVIFSGITKQVLKEAFLDLTLIFGFLPKGNIEVVGVGWTLGVIFAFYILFPFFVFLIWNKRRAWITLGICLVIRYGCESFFENDGSTVMANILLWSVQFIIGGLLFLYKDVLSEKFKNKRLALVMSLLLLIGAMVCNFTYLQNDGVGKILVLLTFCVAIIYAISNKSFLLENKFSQLAGKYCLEIYLSHMMIFRVIEKVPINNVIHNEIIVLIITYVVTVAGTLIFSIIANHVINKTEKLIEGKINK